MNQSPLEHKQIIVRIPFYEAISSGWSVTGKLTDAGIPVSTISGTLYRGTSTWWDDVCNQERVYVWTDATGANDV